MVCGAWHAPALTNMPTKKHDDELLKNLPKVKQVTSFKPQYSCALANIGFEGWKAQEIEAKLMEKHRIHTVSIVYEKLNGIRVTPSIYTSIRDLDVLIKGLTEISKMDAPTASK